MKQILSYWQIITNSMTTKDACLQRVKEYLVIREGAPGKELELASFFSDDGSLIDKDGKSHNGMSQLMDFFVKNPGNAYTLSNKKEPVMKADGSVIYEFYASWYLVGSHVRVTFLFDKKTGLFKTVTVSKF